MQDAKRFVYIIQSVSRQGVYYTGLTSNVDARVQDESLRGDTSGNGRPADLLALPRGGALHLTCS